MYDENPAHPMMEPFKSEFIQARRKDLLKIKTNSINFMETEILLNDWKSYCEPYGFGYLRALSSQALIELAAGSISAELLCEIDNYLDYHEQLLAGATE